MDLHGIETLTEDGHDYREILQGVKIVVECVHDACGGLCRTLVP